MSGQGSTDSQAVNVQGSDTLVGLMERIVSLTSQATNQFIVVQHKTSLYGLNAYEAAQLAGEVFLYSLKVDAALWEAERNIEGERDYALMAIQHALAVARDQAFTAADRLGGVQDYDG
jgi:hypothetical protein